MIRRHHCISAIRAVPSSRRGATAVTVAIAVPALLGMVALGIDVSSAVSAHARLRQAADTAALAAVREAAVLTANNSAAPLQGAQTAGTQRFYAQASSIPRVNVPQVTVNVSRQDLTITATVAFNGNYATQLAGALSSISPSYGPLASIPLGGTVAAQQKVGAYVDIQVLMDTSNSMAIGATQQDQSTLGWATTYVPMWNDPPRPQQNYAGSYGWQGCGVACHATLTSGYKIAPIPDSNVYPFPLVAGYAAKPPLYGSLDPLQLYYQASAKQVIGPGFQPNPSGWPAANASTYDPATYDFYALARWLGITLRIDLLKSSATSIAKAVATAPDADKFRFGLYTFDLDARQNYPLGSASSAGPAINSVQVSPLSYPNTPPNQTNVGLSIKNFTNNSNWVVPAGDGSSPAQAEKVVIIMTDGVEDYTSPTNWARVISPFDAKACAGLTTPVSQNGKGYSVFILQAADQNSFISGATDTNGGTLINHNNPPYPDGSAWTASETFNASAAALLACAGGDPTHYYLASSPQDIQNATNAIINLALSRPTVLTLAPQPPKNSGGTGQASSNGTSTFLPSGG